jgi:glycosyltransferase involved in cell wall biosynthesis
MRLIMLGAAPGTPGAIADTVQAWRDQGLFQRWPSEHVAVHGQGTSLRKALEELAYLLARERGAVHVHTCGDEFWRAAALMAAAATSRSAAILQLHGSGFQAAHERAGPVLRLAMQMSMRRAAGVIVSTAHFGRWLTSTYRGVQVALVPPPVPQTAAGAPLHERPRLVLFLGRLEARRGTFELAQAVASLRAEVPGLRLVYAGEGDRSELALHAQQLGIADVIKFTGWVGPSGKRALLETAAVLAAPSYDDGLPMGVLEAMAAGVPVVASAVSGVLEAVSDGVSGLLGAPGDAATLTRHLRRLLLEPQTAARIGAAARETARLRYSPERSLAALEELYAEVGLRSLVAPSVPREPDMRQAA